MPRFTSPPHNQLDKLRQPLSEGERIVFDFFDKHLAEQWEIYIKPHLNGLRPDFVLLNPEVGIAVFNVCDWNPNQTKWPEENGNPLDRAYQCKMEIYELYCPRLAHGAGFAVTTAGVVFPFADDNLINHFMDRDSRYDSVSGQSTIEKGDIKKVFPSSAYTSSKYMNSNAAKDLRNWLIEPDFSAAQRRELPLNQKQQGYVTSRTATGYRRLKGPAGSGKSLVLAARAAELASEGKEVLVVTFNITLIHYLLEIASRRATLNGNTRSNITWLNFHYWCKRICIDCNAKDQYKKLWYGTDNKARKDVVLDKELPALASSLIDGENGAKAPRYDAILVDEGQDYLPSWWAALRKVCRENGERLLVKDTTQDIYERRTSWTDEAMINAGFRGEWAELKVSYRMPQTVTELASKFATEFLPKEDIEIPISPQTEMAQASPCKLRWVHTNREDTAELANICVQEFFAIAPNADPKILSLLDITFLTSNREMGFAFVEAISEKNVRVSHTFSREERDERKMKMRFHMDNPHIKATTIHSFKGWESRSLIIFIDKGSKDQMSLIYTGLTRLKQHAEGSYLTVVSCVSELEKHARAYWPSFEVK